MERNHRNVLISTAQPWAREYLHNAIRAEEAERKVRVLVESVEGFATATRSQQYRAIARNMQRATASFGACIMNALEAADGFRTLMAAMPSAAHPVHRERRPFLRYGRVGR